ncbi:3'(2') 5'-bisphosphate nucleotidase [Bienertia sinuspersici]
MSGLRNWVLDPINGGLWGGSICDSIALLDQRKVVIGVFACPNFPLEPLGLKSSAGQNAFLFSAVIGEETYMEALHGSPSQILFLL